MENLDNGGMQADKSKTLEKSIEDLTGPTSLSPGNSISKVTRAITVRWV